MAAGDPYRASPEIELKPHAYDPTANPELFDGVLPRRVVAFFIDVVIIGAPVAAAWLLVTIFGFFTFGLGWLLIPVLWPATIVWALVYYGLTFGSPASATIGMRVMDLEMRTWYGAPCYFVLGAVHPIVFYVSISFLTPLVLFVCFFNQRRRLLHDLVLGTVVINNETRAAILQADRAGLGPGSAPPA
jgi:uncharacterized RDD family membrane protein YckC